MNYKDYQDAMEKERLKRLANFNAQWRISCIGVLLLAVSVGLIIYLIVR